jgi:hypothetical protein
MFTTFDSFAPPQLQRKVVESGWADVDLSAVKEKLAEVIEEEKANDPKELRRQIGELKKQLASVPKPAPIEKVKEVQILADAHVKRLETIAGRLEAEGVKLVETGEKMLAEAASVRQTITSATARMAGQSAPVIQRTGQNIPQNRQFIPQKPPSIPKTRPSIPSDGSITPRQQRFLDAAASLTTLNAEVTRETVAAWVGVHPRGGSVGEELGALVEQGLIENNRGAITVTAAGMAAAEEIDPSKAIERATSGLTNRQQKFFAVITAAYPKA